MLIMMSLGQTFAAGSENWPDVVILGSSYYSGYAGEGALWDMTDAWNNSELKKNPNTDVSVVEGNISWTDICTDLRCLAVVVV